MDRADIALELDHLYWVRDRILDAADAPGVPLTDPDPPTIRDLRSTLVHELDVEWSWRRRLASADRRSFPAWDVELDPSDFPTVVAIRERWVAEEAEMRAWLGTLNDADLARPCEADRAGHPLWFHVQHLYTHGLQQLSDAAVLLTRAGRSPGEIDFLDFAASRGGR